MFAIIIQSFLIIYYMSILINLCIHYCFTIENVIFSIFVLACVSSNKKILKSGESEVGGFGFQIKFMRILLILYFLGCTHFCQMSLNFFIFKWQSCIYCVRTPWFTFWYTFLLRIEHIKSEFLHEARYRRYIIDFSLVPIRWRHQEFRRIFQK